ncbi:putative Calcium-binding EF-hand family protein [Hibiscus syriacus]|uniref:Calcium-binding EF-hand family protein n=1 Tax=Hibiscus syriacus TaxID=106335 RepID=A0A6A2YXH0_HIBSY|nr:UPF0481 protein At3g47200-like [Hibiscus syriacus]KAE8684123.1 putative Calcium-binding EF-hand family protein [Hibiscus syriacus]
MRKSREEHVEIDVQDLMSSYETLAFDDFIMSSKCCIFKTPIILYRHNRQAYVPDAFSIGPWHYGRTHSKGTQNLKLKYLEGLIHRSPNPPTQLVELEEAIREIQLQARECYGGPVEFSDEEFVKILVLDGCFIIELFRKDADEIERDEDDPIFTMSCMLQFLYHDLILLENQVPWMVLEILFNLTRSANETMSLAQLAIEFFGNMFSSDAPPMDQNLFFGKEIKHIIDLLRMTLVLPSEKGDETDYSGWQPIPSASKLKEAGVSFKKVESKSILDIKFNNGVLEIPSLLIQETTETVFRNLISFEQCYPNCTPRLTSYAILLDNLIDTTDDMEVLCKKDVIDNWLNLDDATKFFNKLYFDAYVKEFHYHELCNQVHGYCSQWWHRWHAFYMHNYFGKPWAIVSQVFAIIILTLTALQAVYSIIK